MRKYYNRRRFAEGAERNISNPLQGKDVLSVYVSAHVDQHPWLQPLLDALKASDMKLALEIAEQLGDPSRLYMGQPLSEVRIRRQVAAFLKKYPFTSREFPGDPTLAAKLKWRAAEDLCRETNERIRMTSREALPSWVFRARGLIADLLPTLEPTLLMYIIGLGKHGPGSTTSNHGGRVTPYYKYNDFPYTVTRSAARYAFAAMSSDRHWMEVLESSGNRKELPIWNEPLYSRDLAIMRDCVTLVEPDMITFVPKDCRTDRPIAIGNSLNLYLQLGVNAYITRRLQSVGIDLLDQSRNQELARQGSRYAFLNGVENPSQFATIDLASASDTISYELVKMLLPSDWFRFLDDLRHKTGVLDGKEFLYEKFSAMGNGFTFSLESLIFWAVAKAAILDAGLVCSKSDIGVFGDDIIVRASASPHVVAALNWAGFAVNAEKSFVTGPFKESCGADYFNGNDVRPFYLKRRILSHEDCYFICNSLSHRIMRGWRDRGLYAVFTAVLNSVLPRQRLYRPLGEDLESGLHVPLNYMRQLGVTPWLSLDELKDLRAAKLLRDGYRKKDKREYPNLQTMWAWRIVVSPYSYSGKGYLRMYLWLLGKGESPSFERFIRAEDRLHKEAASAGMVTRRNSTTRHINVEPVQKWNGIYTEHQLASHPVFWM